MVDMPNPPLRRSFSRWLVDLALVVVVLLVGGVVVREILHIGGQGERDEGKRTVPLAITSSELGQNSWQVGNVTLTRQNTVYQASVLNEAGQELFKLKADTNSGRLLGPGEERLAQPAATPLPVTQVKQSLSAALSDLALGKVEQKENKPFYEAALIYQGREVARVRLDPATSQIIPSGVKLEESRATRPQREGGAKEARKKDAKVSVTPKNLVVPLGWGSALIMIVSSLYYSWKRSLYAPLRAAGGEAKTKAIAGLRSTLWLHMALGVAATGIAVVHVLNFTAKIRLSVSWLTLGMAFVVALSGVFGKFVAKSEMVRHTWRRFHVPFTVLFFVVLFIHILEKTGVLGD